MDSNIYKTFKSKLIFSKYLIKHLISKGSFGEVYFGTNIINGKNYALKIEEGNKQDSSLKHECYILLNLKGQGIPSVISFGVSNKYNILVENLLGRSIRDIWVEKNRKLNLKDTCIFAIQAISRLEFVHSKNYLHRDIKPANFLLGNPDNSQIYLIDFGNAKKFRSSRTGKHIRYMKSQLIFGSLLFLSMNTFKGIEQTRKDELESLGFVIIYLFNGSLPWSKIKFNTIYEGLTKIYAIRKKVSIENICSNMPKEFNIYMNYVNNLKYEQCPNYEYLRNLFLNILKKIGDANEQLFSWVDKNKNLSSKQSSSKNRNRSIYDIFNNLLKKNSHQLILCPNLNMQLNNNEEQVKNKRNNSDIIKIKKITGNNSINNNSPNFLNGGKHRQIIIKGKDIKKIDSKKEKTNEIRNLNAKIKSLKNKLVLVPKKINLKQIDETPKNKQNNIGKIIKENNLNNIYGDLSISDKARNKYTNKIIYSKNQLNSYNNDKMENYINIANFNINNNSNIFINKSFIKKHDSQKLDIIKRNKINQIKIFSYHSRIDSNNNNSINDFQFKPKLYKSIFNNDSSSHLNLTEYRLNLDKYKLLHSEKNSIHQAHLLKLFKRIKNLIPLLFKLILIILIIIIKIINYLIFIN